MLLDALRCFDKCPQVLNAFYATVNASLDVIVSSAIMRLVIEMKSGDEQVMMFTEPLGL